MTQETGNAVAILVVSSVLGLAVVWQLGTGQSYIAKPPQKVFRSTDPFSYWLSVLIQLGICLVLGAGDVGVLMGLR